MAHFERFVAFTLLHEEIGKSIQRIKTEYMQQFGLRSGDALFLAILARHPEGLSAAALARECGVDKAVISRALPVLLSSGAVTLGDGAAEKHAYRARLCLSECGREIVEKMRTYSVSAVKTASTGISTEDLAVFYRVLRTINQNLTEHADKNGEEGENS